MKDASEQQLAEEFESLQRAFDEAHKTRSKNFKIWELGQKDLLESVKNECNKRKNDRMEVDQPGNQGGAKGQEDPKDQEEEEVSDDDEKEKDMDMTGVLEHDMSKQQKMQIIGWLTKNQDLGAKAMITVSPEQMTTKGVDLNYPQVQLSRYIYDAVIGNKHGSQNAWKLLPREGNQCHGWYPIGTIMDHICHPDVWGNAASEETVWRAITETMQRSTGKTSFMTKTIRDYYVLIKARPRPMAKYQTSTPASISSKGDEVWQHWDKKEDQTKKDGSQYLGAPWAQEHSEKKKKEEEASASAASATPGRKSDFWYVGDKTPSAWSGNAPTAWRTIKKGDKCPWTARIANCTRAEDKINKT
jgi:hypothetical protein